MENLYPLLDDFAEFAIDFDFIVPVGARTDDAGAISDETAVLVRPFYDFEVVRAFSHFFVSLSCLYDKAQKSRFRARAYKCMRISF